MGTNERSPVREDGFQTQFIYIDIDKLSEQSGMENGKKVLLVDALGPDPPGKFPIRHTTGEYLDFSIMPDMHHVYAYTWYTLSVAIVGVAFARFRKRIHVRARPPQR